LGHDAVVLPLLAVRVMPDISVDLHGVAALAFTSANGVRAFADASGERSLKVFAVGAATALAARQAGFKSVLSADGDVEALADGLPKDPAQYRPRPLMGPGFFAIIAFGILCVLAGVGVAYLGPRLLPPKPQAPAMSPAPPQPAPAPAAAPQAPPPAPSAEVE